MTTLPLSPDEWISVFEDLAATYLGGGASFPSSSFLEGQTPGNSLHRVAGWLDIHDNSEWDAYVLDSVGGAISPSSSIFEFGCGVSAFLSTLKKSIPLITVGGVDLSPSTIAVAKASPLLSEEERKRFVVADAVETARRMPSNSEDVTLSNSVFQYLPDPGTADTLVREMIRVARKTVIVADVCDAQYEGEVKAKVTAMYNRNNANSTISEAAPEMLTFHRKWWKRFEACPDVESVEIRQVSVQEYHRRNERYVVTIRKSPLS